MASMYGSVIVAQRRDEPFAGLRHFMRTLVYSDAVPLYGAPIRDLGGCRLWRARVKHYPLCIPVTFIQIASSNPPTRLSVRNDSADFSGTITSVRQWISSQNPARPFNL